MYVTQNIIFRLWMFPNSYPVCESSLPLHIPFNPLPINSLSLRNLTPNGFNAPWCRRSSPLIPKASTTFHQWALRLFPYIEPEQIILLLSDINTILWNHNANTIKTFLLQNIEWLFPNRQKIFLAVATYWVRAHLIVGVGFWLRFLYFFLFSCWWGEGGRGLGQGHWSGGEARQPVW